MDFDGYEKTLTVLLAAASSFSNDAPPGMKNDRRVGGAEWDIALAI